MCIAMHRQTSVWVADNMRDTETTATSAMMHASLKGAGVCLTCYKESGGDKKRLVGASHGDRAPQGRRRLGCLVWNSDGRFRHLQCR